MELKATHVYEASVDRVFRSFGTKEEIAAKQEALGARNVSFEQCDLTENSLSLTMHREVPVEAPSMLKKFLADWNKVTQTETWSGTPGKTYTGHFEIDLHGVPVTIKGTCVLTGDDQRCTNEVTVQVDCSIPLVGKKLAAFTAENCEKSMQDEYEFIKKLVEA